ncbi:class II glutamine amidotransferase, partial [Candidatus Woesearchaeota archaeon]|nr:class II glutamine amidotransferase [Candidatus Woesearchaeota archaeon]
MCGIIGYKGSRNANEVIIKSLKKLEYRGYDSWGIALKQNNKLKLIKKVGKIGQIENFSEENSNIGIGHTRWATHGEVNEQNAHPHLSSNKEIVVVHNGIIENYEELKNELKEKDFVFQ